MEYIKTMADPIILLGALIILATIVYLATIWIVRYRGHSRNLSKSSTVKQKNNSKIKKSTKLHPDNQHPDIQARTSKKNGHGKIVHIKDSTQPGNTNKDNQTNLCPSKPNKSKKHDIFKPFIPNTTIKEDKKQQGAPFDKKQDVSRKINFDDKNKWQDVTYENKKDVFKPSISNNQMKPLSLTNIGATCYLNSAFQGISACDTFVQEMHDLCDKYQSDEVRQLHVFKELMDILNGCSTHRMEISRNPIFHNWNKPGQQDSYELLAYALNQVYNELRKHKETIGHIKRRDLAGWLQEVLPMRFIIQYQIICGCGMRTSSFLQSDLALHVSIPRYGGHCKLDKLIGLYFAEDAIEDYECDKEDCPGTGAKRLARLCRPLPRTVCIHLQRTFWNGYEMVKINKDIKFGTELILKSEYFLVDHKEDEEKETKEKMIQRGPVEESVDIKDIKEADLDMGNVLSELAEGNEPISNNVSNASSTNHSLASATSVQTTSDFRNSEKKDKSDISIVESQSSLNIVEDNDTSDLSKSEKKDESVEPDEVYNLVSVTEHSGTVYGGHYVFYKRMGKQWYLTNDLSVREVSEREVLTCQAYILFYEQEYKTKGASN